jgi:hypothetical protein
LSTIQFFLAGVFLANGIPHFVQGISGRKFPTPFAKPPGKGLSPPFLNSIWGIFNFLAALILYVLAERLILGWNAGFISFLVGFLLTTIVLSLAFQKAERDI